MKTASYFNKVAHYLGGYLWQVMKKIWNKYIRKIGGPANYGRLGKFNIEGK